MRHRNFGLASRAKWVWDIRKRGWDCYDLALMEGTKRAVSHVTCNNSNRFSKQASSAASSNVYFKCASALRPMMQPDSHLPPPCNCNYRHFTFKPTQKLKTKAYDPSQMPTRRVPESSLVSSQRAVGAGRSRISRHTGGLFCGMMGTHQTWVEGDPQA